MKLIVTKPGGARITAEGKQAFKLVCESIGIVEAVQPVARFPQKSIDIIREIAKLRKKDWRSTSRWNHAADETGLFGEIAVQRYLGVKPENAVTDFLSGLQGDRGWDLEAMDLKLDCKATQGQALKFKFSKTNRSSHLADGFVFIHIEYAGIEVWAHLLGWVRRHEIKPFLRDDGQRFFVRAETLRREGILKPIGLLKPSQKVTYSLLTSTKGD